MIRDAATIILVRRRAQRVEVLLVRRHDKSGFFGGAHVFPGGKVDAADEELGGDDSLAPGLLARAMAEIEPTPGRPHRAPLGAGLFAAACRELLEEAGVLVAQRPDASPATAEDVVQARGLLGRGLSFGAALRALGLVLALDGVRYHAHWITPSFETRRFDTRFFVAQLPEGQEALPDGVEVTERRWLGPTEALALQARGEIMLPPPTLMTLHELAEWCAVEQSVAALLRQGQARPVVPILPKIGTVLGGLAMVAPWDSAYAGIEGESLPVEIQLPTEVRRQPSRVVMSEGLFRLGWG